VLVTGFHLSMCDITMFDAAVADAGLRQRHRFATWDLGPWPQSGDAEFCVTVLEV
jgi:hypothetical protein